MRMLPFTFRAYEELELGPVWQGVFEERWPHYRSWFLRDGEADRPSYATSVRMLRAHMPELMPAYERVVELAGGGDLAARMLSLYRPPPYLAACSQGAWVRPGGPVLSDEQRSPGAASHVPGDYSGIEGVSNPGGRGSAELRRR